MLISTPIPENASIAMTRAEYMDARQDAVNVALPELATLRQQLATANATIASKQELLNTANQYIARLEVENNALKAAQTTPPVIVIPDPVITPPVMPAKFAGAYFEDPRPDDSVNDATQAKAHADALIPLFQRARTDTELKDAITYCSIEDLKYGRIPQALANFHFRWWISPVQALYRIGQPDQPAFIRHLEMLNDAGVYGVFIDDAQDKTRGIPANDMPRLLDLINQYLPDAPVVCSFAADFDDRDYPKTRYADARQWFTRQQESEAVWFPKWEAGQDAQIYTADVWRRSNGYMHPPERVRQAFDISLPLVEGIAWYSICNRGWNHIAEHDAARAKNKDAVTMWQVIQECTAKYMKRA